MFDAFVRLAPTLCKERVVDIARRLQERYNEPQRHYHTWAHLERGYGESKSVDAQLTPVEFFAWAYHDAFYVPTARDNEEKSAVLWLQDYETLGFDVDQADEGVELIRSTDPSRIGTSVVNDMDLCILGAPLKTYFQYVANVREEYGFLSDECWRAGRTEVLNMFTERVRKGTLYNTLGFAAEFTFEAGRNMEVELEILKGVSLRAGTR